MVIFNSYVKLPEGMEFIASSVPTSEKSSPVLEINPLGRWRLRTGVFPWYPARGIPKKMADLMPHLCWWNHPWLFWVRSSPLDLTLWLWLTVRHGIDGSFIEVYLLKILIFHGYVSHNQMVFDLLKDPLWKPHSFGGCLTRIIYQFPCEKCHLSFTLW